MPQRTFLGALFLTCVLASGTGAQSRPQQALLEAGTVIPVRLSETLSSRDSRKGDAFTAKLRVEDKSNYSGLPAGTLVEGTVREARRQRGEDPGMLDLDFQRLRFPDGRSYPIQGSLIGLDAKSVTRTNDGRLVAKPAHRNDRAAYVGYGAGIGLIAGIIRKRPLEDTLLGAGLGLLIGSTQKTRTEPRDIVLKEGTELGVRLDGRFGYAELEGEGERHEDSNTEASAKARRRTGEEEEAAEPALREEPEGRSERPERGEVSGSEIEIKGATTDIGVLIDEDEVPFDSNVRPVVSEGKILVPANPVLRAAKIRSNFDREKQELTVMSGEGTIRISAGSRIALINGSKRVRLSAPAQRLNGTLYAPLRFYELVFGHPVQWDAATRTVLIVTQSEESGAEGKEKEAERKEKPDF